MPNYAPLLPFLTEYDPAISSEGSLDPLNLYPIADRLGSRFVPGLRERMRHPRFMTAMAAGTYLCLDYDEDAVAKDGVSPPYQVFEWYLVQALVKTYRDTGDIIGLPGRDKATLAMRQGLPLCNDNYLKAPSVFGFHGVYRTLAEQLDIIRRGRLGEAGDRLLRTWEEDQNLEGFYGSADGPGRVLRDALRSAISDGMQKGAVAREWSWSKNTTIAESFAPYRFKSRERDAIFDLLGSSDFPHRQALIRFLTSSEGQRLFNGTADEKEVHSGLLKSADNELKELIRCIQIYEKFARLLQDAFDECLWMMSDKRSTVTVKELSNLGCVKTAFTQLPKVYEEVAARLDDYSQRTEFDRIFQTLHEFSSRDQWLEYLLQHHIHIQKSKPPAGKMPWYSRMDDGSYAGRTLYRKDEQPKTSDRYVHAYRIRALWSFLLDLKKVNVE